MEFLSGDLLVLGHQVDGFGDLSGTMHLANQMHTRGGLSEARIVYATNSPKGAQLFNKYDFTIVSYDELEEIRESYAFALQIVFSCCQFAHVVGPIIGEHSYREIPPTLILYEHGFPVTRYPYLGNRFSFYSLGVSKERGELGMITHRNLEPIPDTRETKMLELSEVSTPLRECLLKTSSLTQFIDSSLLYVTYPRILSVLIAYINTMIQLNEERAASQHVFIAPSFAWHSEELRYSIGKSDASDMAPEYPLTIEQYDEAKGSSRIVFQRGGEGPLVRLILGSISHSDMMHLSRASEKETIVTGNETPGEMAALGKCFQYDPPSHKFSFAEDLQAIWNTLPPFDEDATSTLTITEETDEEGMLQFFQRQRGDGFRKMTSWSTHLMTEWDCFPKITALAERALSTLPEEKDPWFNLRKREDGEIPLDMPVWLNKEQLVSLHLTHSAEFAGRDIQYKSPVIGDSTFRVETFMLDYNLVMRRANVVA